MSLSLGACLGSHWTVSPWARAGGQGGRGRLAEVDRPIVRTIMTGLVGLPGRAPSSPSSLCRRAMKSVLRLVVLVCTMSLRATGSRAPILATVLA